jgi:hypothetical protein
MTTINKRVTGEIEGPFVLFLIGARINHVHKLGKWLPVVRAMGGMLTELSKNRADGLMHFDTWLSWRQVMLVQYWRSFEALHAYSTSRDRQHIGAWAAFNKAIGANGDVGIWHETYLVDPGRCENIYANMPVQGIIAAGQMFDATGARAQAPGRLKAQMGSQDAG